MLALTWTLSVLPLVLGWGSGGELVLGGAYQSGLVLLPWVFFAGLPRSRRGTPLGTGWLLGMLLPPLCLALGLDLGRGASGEDLLALVLSGVAVSVL